MEEKFYFTKVGLADVRGLVRLQTPSFANSVSVLVYVNVIDASSRELKWSIKKDDRKIPVKCSYALADDENEVGKVKLSYDMPKVRVLVDSTHAAYPQLLAQKDDVNTHGMIDAERKPMEVTLNLDNGYALQLYSELAGTHKDLVFYKVK